MQGVLILLYIHLLSYFLLCLESSTCTPPFLPSCTLFFGFFTPLQSLSSLVPVMHVRTLRGMREEERVCVGSELEKNRGEPRKGGKRKSSRPVTPSEHLKLPAGLSSASPHIAPPISANPTGLPGLGEGWKHTSFPLRSLVFDSLPSFVPVLFSSFTLASYCTKAVFTPSWLKGVMWRCASVRACDSAWICFVCVMFLFDCKCVGANVLVSVIFCIFDFSISPFLNKFSGF